MECIQHRTNSKSKLRVGHGVHEDLEGTGPGGSNQTPLSSSLLSPGLNVDTDFFFHQEKPEISFLKYDVSQIPISNTMLSKPNIFVNWICPLCHLGVDAKGVCVEGGRDSLPEHRLLASGKE